MPMYCNLLLLEYLAECYGRNSTGYEMKGGGKLNGLEIAFLFSSASDLMGVE